MLYAINGAHPPSMSTDNHIALMRHALALAEKSPPKPSNFRVGAVIVEEASGTVIAEGYTLECPGNTHAEQCCLIKLAEKHNTTEEGLAALITTPHTLYTTMEPCFRRLSGNLPCVDRIIRQAAWIKHVYVGVQEPETFVGPNPGRQLLESSDITVTAVPGLEADILKVATAGHTKE